LLQCGREQRIGSQSLMRCWVVPRCFLHCLVNAGPERIKLDGVHRERLDVTNPDAIAAAESDCTDVNLLINNAGIALWTGFFECDFPESPRESRHFVHDRTRLKTAITRTNLRTDLR
jgi:NAD(P)-dependent dehydrogenase (short-subunit alcohol dehydrogenase family)